MLVIICLSIVHQCPPDLHDFAGTLITDTSSTAEVTFMSFSKRLENASKYFSRIEEECGVIILGEAFVFKMEQAASGDQNLARTTASAQKPVAEGGDGATVMETGGETVDATEGAGGGTVEATETGGETAEMPEVTVEEMQENKAEDDGPAVEATEAGTVMATETRGEAAEMPGVTVEEVQENKAEDDGPAVEAIEAGTVMATETGGEATEMPKVAVEVQEKAGDGKPAVEGPERVKAVGENGDVEKSADVDVAMKENDKKV